MAAASRDAYEAELKRAGRGRITTEIAPAPAFYFAEEDHQQYLAKNPYGYCGLQGHRRRLRHSRGRRRLTGTVLPCGCVCRTSFPKGQNSS